jgi:hypothetical protein
MIAIEPDSVRSFLDWIASGETKYACQFHVQITWPQTVTHEGSCFDKTGKEGVRFSDGMPSAEYWADQGRRLWLGLDGRIEGD